MGASDTSQTRLSRSRGGWEQPKLATTSEAHTELMTPALTTLAQQLSGVSEAHTELMTPALTTLAQQLSGVSD
jgi:hypothetical protein